MRIEGATRHNFRCRNFTHQSQGSQQSNFRDHVALFSSSAHACKASFLSHEQKSIRSHSLNISSKQRNRCEVMPSFNAGAKLTGTISLGLLTVLTIFRSG
jgi:hypothetical protein